MVSWLEFASQTNLSVFVTKYMFWSESNLLLNQAKKNKPELNSAPCPQTHLDAVNKKSHKPLSPYVETPDTCSYNSS